MIYESLSSPTDTNNYLKDYNNLSADTFKELLNAFSERGDKKESNVGAGKIYENNGYEKMLSMHKSAYIFSGLSHPDKLSSINLDAIKDVKPIGPSEDSLLYYTNAFKQGSITPDQLGKFQTLALDSLINYPDIFSYDEATRFRVASSVLRKIGVVNYDLPYSELYKLYKTFTYAQDDPKRVINKFVKSGLLDSNQSGYLIQAVDVISHGTKSVSETDVINMDTINAGLDALANRAQNDKTLSESQSFALASMMKIMSASIGYLDNIKMPDQANCCCEEQSYTAEKKSPCFRCVNNHVGILLVGLVIAALFVAFALLVAAAGAVPLGIIIAGIFLPISVSLFETIFNRCKVECGIVVAPVASGYPYCPQCPGSEYFFDGANCYMGWYHSNHIGWVYGDAFWYFGDTVFGCSDGNLTPTWAFAGFATGHGIASGGGTCLFGYNYSTAISVYTPFVTPDGFYVKPYCKK